MSTYFFVKIGDYEKIFVYLYIENLNFIENDNIVFDDFKIFAMYEFEMFNLGKMYDFLDLEGMQSNDGIFVSQEK